MQRVRLKILCKSHGQNNLISTGQIQCYSTDIREVVIPLTAATRNTSGRRHFPIKWVLQDLLPRSERPGDIDVVSRLRIGGDTSQHPP